jgi:eukaryotic-like serine/threonine-protein kinase
MSTRGDWPTEPVAGPPPPVPLDDPATTLVGPPGGPVGLPPRPLGEGPDDRIGLGMLIGLLVVVAAGAVVAAILLTRHHHKASRAATSTVFVTTKPATTVTTAAAAANVAVPTLIGGSKADAARALHDDGLGVRLVTVPGPPPAGRVLAESPAPGQRVQPHATVTVSISNGAQRATTKTVTTAAPAQTTTVGATPTAPATSASQSTSQSTTTAQATTTSSASSTTTPAPSGPATVSVADVTGKDVQAAAQAFNRAGLLATIAYVPGTDPLGTVIAENPAPGSSAPTGSHVTINASSGPGEKEQKTVPDVTGQSIPQAVSTLQHAGLRLIFVKKAVTDRSLAGKVVEQTPSAGKTAPKNAQVLVYMGAFKQG